MDLQPMAGPVIYALMLVGLCIAAAGLFLIFKRKGDEAAERVEILGMKLQSSSAGTIVFLVGAVLLAAPLFVPRSAGTPVSHASVEVETPVASPQGGTALVLPPSANTPEQEPNNLVTQANQFSLGHGAGGTLDRERDDMEDWYVVDLGDSEATDYEVQVRNLGGGCRVVVFDQNEEKLDSQYCDNDGGSRIMSVFAPDNDRLYLRVTFNTGSGSRKARYEVFAREG